MLRFYTLAALGICTSAPEMSFVHLQVQELQAQILDLEGKLLQQEIKVGCQASS